VGALVRPVPTLLVMLDGQVVAQQPGAPPTEVLRTWLEDALSRAG
jgi:thioredoxin 2